MGLYSLSLVGCFYAMTIHKLPGTVQVDVDDLWVYYESIGRRAPAGCPSPAYEQGVPRLLDLFDRYGIRATFFVCGRDVQAQRATLREMIRRGHEIANHSTWHRPGFARLSAVEKQADIATTHRLLADGTGVEPRGFKSPGFSFAPDQLDALAGFGYRYDSSLLPTPYAPMMRVAQRLLSGGTVDPTHYGQARYGLAPLRPYTPSRHKPHRPAEANTAAIVTRRIAPRGRSGASRTGTRPYPTGADEASQTGTRPYPTDAVGSADSSRIAPRGRSGASQTGTRPYPTGADDASRTGTMPYPADAVGSADSCRIAPCGRSGVSQTGTKPYPTDAVGSADSSRIAPRGRSGASQTGTRPYPTTQDSIVIEAPVTTMPLTRLPMHSTFVFTAGQPLFDAGLALAVACNVPVNYLLHAADAIDPVADPALASYRFLTQSWEEKHALLDHMLSELAGKFRLVPTLEYVDALVR